ncbi:hypothetical protein RFI_05062, partial [Reticulomyxa filosa]
RTKTQNESKSYFWQLLAESKFEWNRGRFKFPCAILISAVGIAQVSEPRTNVTFANSFKHYDGTQLDLISTGYFRPFHDPFSKSTLLAAYGVYRKQYNKEELKQFEQKRTKEFEELKKRRLELIKQMSPQQYKKEYINKDPRYQIQADPALDHMYRDLTLNDFPFHYRRAYFLQQEKQSTATTSSSSFSQRSQAPEKDNIPKNGQKFLSAQKKSSDNTKEPKHSTNPTTHVMSTEELQRSLLQPAHDMDNVYVYSVQFVTTRPADIFWQLLFQELNRYGQEKYRTIPLTTVSGTLMNNAVEQLATLNEKDTILFVCNEGNHQFEIFYLPHKDNDTNQQQYFQLLSIQSDLLCDCVNHFFLDQKSIICRLTQGIPIEN